MKRFVIRLLVFLSLMFIFDRGFGVAMKYLQDHAKGGYIGHHNYILNQSNEDILIFGSSRAIHHYNPQIIEDSLGMSCYNCGQDGNGIVLFYGWWQIIKERYSPKFIIYEVTPDFDILSGKPNNRYLGWLRSEYDNNAIVKLFGDVDISEKYKMQCMMYRHNAKFLQYVIDFVHPIFNISSNGFLPYIGTLDKMKISTALSFRPDYKYDELKLKYLDALVREATENGVRLVFVASPIWYGNDDKVFAPINTLSERYNVPFLNYSNDTIFVHKDIYFKDGSHLNKLGADLFSSILSNDIKNEI